MQRLPNKVLTCSLPPSRALLNLWLNQRLGFGKRRPQLRAEKVLKKIFGERYGPQEIQPYHLFQAMTLLQNFLRARNGAWRRPSRIRRVSRYSCLHCSASWYWPGIKAVWQKNASKPPALTPRSLPPPPREGKCMHIRPPPFSYTWDDYLEKKKIKFGDVSLSSIDLMNPCRGLGIPIKSIFVWSQKQHPLNHSPCIINSDEFGSRGTHRVCCWRSGEGEYEYLDSFGLPVPVEFETELLNKGQKAFLEMTTKFNGLEAWGVVITASFF